MTRCEIEVGIKVTSFEVRAVACSLISIAASNEASGMVSSLFNGTVSDCSAGHIRALKVAFTACRFCFGIVLSRRPTITFSY